MSSLSKVRTFSRDAARAQGGADTAPTAPAPVPPKPVPAAPVKTPAQESHLSDAHHVFDIRNAAEGKEEGVIVKDMKHKRWSLGRELGRAVGSWAETTAEALTTPKKDEGPRVAPASTRADVIAKAGTPGRIAPSDDHPVVVQKLRTFAKDAERATGKPFKIETNIPEEPPQWSSLSAKKEIFTRGDSALESGAAKLFNSLKQGRPARQATFLKNRENVIAKSPDLAVAPQAKQTLPDKAFTDALDAQRAASAPPVRQEPVIARSAAPVAPMVPRAESPIIPPEPPPQPAPVVEPAPEPVREPKEIAEPPRSRDLAFTLPSFSRPEAQRLRTLRDDAIADVEHKRMSVARIAAKEADRRSRSGADIDLRPRSAIMPLIGAGIGVFLFVAIGTTLYVTLRTPTDTPTEVIRIPTLIRTASQSPVALASDRNQFLSDLQSALQNASGGPLVQFYPTLADTTTPAPASAIMEVLDIRAPGSFIRSVEDDMMIGGHLGTVRAPFLVLRSRQFDVAFAGMLAWEENMSADLAPLFGEPVRRTLDPTARTNDQTRTARFVDTVIQNRDVRILFDELGEERLLYTFIDQKTILVTTNSTALAALLSALP